MELDVKPWEIELTDEEINRFELILLDIDGGGKSSICPFCNDTNLSNCNRCIQLFSDIRNINLRLKLSCPCDEFSPEFITERIEKLLQYNELMRKQEHEKVNTS